ncbi:peroxisomal N(1)-acetyl-spermine/spermidine oxidase [Copidosoma floridanum]|uniref:peroxisomal N(1)-acetyl-spermine/spermidine oxidase n=1 Tax=Copidosoma floridanum TaxID=29053 RepID=UPI000C6F9ABF|nr:peroxisomal N(1)-acetyl-spermine/spermidine oxidase [Copidosoma floridanum]
MDTLKTSCKIVIIGAGIAGLSAANYLLSHNEPNFLIVEARSRIGGRIVFTKLGSYKVELGANWIHGILGNPVFELAMANDLVDITSSPTSHKIIAATENGKQIPFLILEEIYTAYICFLRRCEEYFLSSYSPPEHIKSVGEHIALEINIYLDSLTKESRKIRQLLFDCLLKRETCITGCNSMNDIDLLQMGSYTELQGGNISLTHGYSSILEPLCKAIPTEKILTEHAVKKIRWRSDSINDVEKDSSSIKVECNNGTIITCEQVICTLPLGVLKKSAYSIFEPILTAQKLQSIEKLMFGTVNKIILEYDRPFLNPNVSEVMLLWDDGCISSEEQSNLKKSWFRKIYSFIKISETILLGWISGKAAVHMESLSENEVSQVCTNILRSFLNDPFVPFPRRCIYTNWYSEPYSCGSYTAMAVGASQADIQTISEPLTVDNDPSKVKVAFAGEHTHLSFYSTVHGAYLSGRTAAQILLQPKDWEKKDLLSCDTTNDLSSWINGIHLT